MCGFYWENKRNINIFSYSARLHIHHKKVRKLKSSTNILKTRGELKKSLRVYLKQTNSGSNCVRIQNEAIRTIAKTKIAKDRGTMRDSVSRFLRVGRPPTFFPTRQKKKKKKKKRKNGFPRCSGDPFSRDSFSEFSATRPQD